MAEGQRASDLAAKKMGELLLKGYRMLDASCEVCYNVLMQDRLGNNVCVLCEDKQQNEPDTNGIDATMEVEATRITVVPDVVGNRGGGDSVMQDVTLPAELRMRPEDKDWSDVITNLVHEMRETAEGLRRLRVRAVSTNANTIGERADALKHIQFCARLISELQGIQAQLQ